MSVLSDYYQKRCDHFIADLKTIRKLNKARVHQLRISVKKINALHHFTEALSQDRNRIGMPGQMLKPLFRSAGHIREAQINKSIAKAYSNTLCLLHN